LEALAALSAQAEALCLAAGRPDVQVEVDVIGQRPVGELSPDHPLIKLCWCCLEAQGVAPTLHVGSTDANIPLSLGLPAVCLGLTYGRNAHTVDETIELPPLAKGLEQLVSVIEGAFRLYPA
jgi:di/tripeptidase